MTVNDTTDAVWKNQSTIPTSKTNVNDYENYGTQMTTEGAGGHTHTLSGSTQSVSLDQDDIDNSRAHAHNITSDANNPPYVTVGSQNNHAHTVNDATGHSHGISRENLQHYHGASGSGSVSVNNKTVGYSGFEHSHSFYVGGHTHSITIQGHSHTFSLTGHTHKFSLSGHTHKFSLTGHTHKFSLSGHTHKFSLTGHTHKFSLSGHTHKFSLGAHKHTIKIDPHTHNITPGIYEFGNPTKFDIYVSGTKKATVNAKSYDDDITRWLLNDKNQVSRNTWIDVEIVPNDLAYVQASVFVQGFVQSRGGGNY